MQHTQCWWLMEDADSFLISRSICLTSETWRGQSAHFYGCNWISYKSRHFMSKCCLGASSHQLISSPQQKAGGKERSACAGGKGEGRKRGTCSKIQLVSLSPWWKQGCLQGSGNTHCRNSRLFHMQKKGSSVGQLPLDIEMDTVSAAVDVKARIGAICTGWPQLLIFKRFVWQPAQNKSHHQFRGMAYF